VSWLRAGINEIAFSLRTKLRRSHQHFPEPLLTETELSDFASAMIASDRARELTATYRLDAISSTRLYLGVLFLTDLLDRLPPEFFAALPPELAVLDAGAAELESAPAIQEFLRARGKIAKLTGIDVDPKNLPLAESRARRFSARFITGDVLEHRDRYHLIFLLHPFLDETSLLEWGLPLRFLRPRAILEHLRDLLEENGRLVVVNQVGSERDRQTSMLADLGAKFETLEVPVLFRARDEPAYVHLVERMR
jgi:hypothetical protein